MTAYNMYNIILTTSSTEEVFSLLVVLVDYYKTVGKIKGVIQDRGHNWLQIDSRPDAMEIRSVAK